MTWWRPILFFVHVTLSLLFRNHCSLLVFDNAPQCCKQSTKYHNIWGSSVFQQQQLSQRHWLVRVLHLYVVFSMPKLSITFWLVYMSTKGTWIIFLFPMKTQFFSKRAPRTSTKMLCLKDSQLFFRNKKLSSF